MSTELMSKEVEVIFTDKGFIKIGKTNNVQLRSDELGWEFGCKFKILTI